MYNTPRLTILLAFFIMAFQGAIAYYKPALPKNGQSSSGGRPGLPTNPILTARNNREQSAAAPGTTSGTKGSHGREGSRSSSSNSATSTSLSAAASTTTTTEGKRALMGAAKFVRQNPKSDRFQVLGFHHIEFYCGDATNTYRRFQVGLGMNLVAKSDLSTGNNRFASYCLQSRDLKFVFTAPYSVDGLTTHQHNHPGARDPKDASSETAAPGVVVEEEHHPGFNAQHACDFFKKHGTAVRAIGLEVSDATKAYEECIRHGGQAALAPTRLCCSSSSTDDSSDSNNKGSVMVSEIRAYGDVVLRFISRHDGFDGAFLPAYQAVAPSSSSQDYGLERIDHAVGNVWDLLESVNYVGKMTGFHEFAEFTAADVGTMDSGLNSVVLANNEERVLLPLNEPTYGTKRKSQIQTYLEYNNGPGLQHLALQTSDIFSTLTKMREVSERGGFEFVERPKPTYYRDLPARIGEALTAEQYQQVEELGLLVDKDDQGILLQIFTKPIGDRPTMFLEIIQRIGCQEPDPADPKKTIQRGGCGGFGKGNFKALFQAIEEYEKTLKLS